MKDVVSEAKEWASDSMRVGPRGLIEDLVARIRWLEELLTTSGKVHCDREMSDGCEGLVHRDWKYCPTCGGEQDSLMDNGLCGHKSYEGFLCAGERGHSGNHWFSEKNGTTYSWLPTL